MANKAENKFGSGLEDTINPSQLFVEKRQFFNHNNQWLNNIIDH